MSSALSEFPELGVDPNLVQTNIVLLELNGKLAGKSKEFATLLKEQGVSVNVRAASTIRLVTNKDVTTEDAKTAISIIEKTAKEF